MNSCFGSFDDVKKLKAEVFGVAVVEPGRNSGGLPAPEVASRSRVFFEGVATGGVEKQPAKKALTAIEKAALEADEAREKFKASKRNDFKEEMVQGENTGMSTKSQKYDRRLLMNRKSAAASRVRRDAYTKALEKQLLILEEKTQVLEGELKVAEEENKDLRKMFPMALDRVPQNSASVAPSVSFEGDLGGENSPGSLELQDVFLNDDFGH